MKRRGRDSTLVFLQYNIVLCTKRAHIMCRRRTKTYPRCHPHFKCPYPQCDLHFKYTYPQCGLHFNCTYPQCGLHFKYTYPRFCLHCSGIQNYLGTNVYLFYSCSRFLFRANVNTCSASDTRDKCTCSVGYTREKCTCVLQCR